MQFNVNIVHTAVYKCLSHGDFNLMYYIAVTINGSVHGNDLFDQ